jgi:hypothetical protein
MRALSCCRWSASSGAPSIARRRLKGPSYHLCKGLLTDHGNYGLGRTFLAEMSKQEQDPSESFFAGIKELIDQVLFGSDVPGQQMRYEQI